jgi:hypothetical protein
MSSDARSATVPPPADSRWVISFRTAPTTPRIGRKYADEVVGDPGDPELAQTEELLLVRDGDAMVATATVDSTGVTSTNGAPRVAAGEYVAKDHPALKADPEAFVPLAPPGLRRRDALVALATCRHKDGDGEERFVHRGQWVHRDDPLVALHPHQFAPPLPEAR